MEAVKEIIANSLGVNYAPHLNPPPHGGRKKWE
jgi:hypothetical protein